MIEVRRILLSAALATVITATAQDEFSMLEQQQISIETPGLFANSNAFSVDFAAIRPTEYSFPLPVGKAEVQKDNWLEITTSPGDAVKAMFSGTVRISKKHQTLGNVVVVRHDNGLETVYGYNAQNLVKVGDRVKAGQTVAIVGGDKGRVFCMFSMMVNGGRINPATLIGIKSHRLLRQTVMFKKAAFNVDLSVVTPDKLGDKALADDGGKTNMNTNPFAGGNKFTLNLANLDATAWCYPLAGAKVISAYGRRGRRNHTGVDIKTRPNDNIKAAFDGVVIMSQTYSGYGKCIRIRHSNGLETLYSHNSKNLVKAGDVVKAGQVIALVGRTGRATTEHLHFECRVNGRPFDPGKIFNHATHSLRMETLTFTKRGNSVSITSGKNYMAKGKR